MRTDDCRQHGLLAILLALGLSLGGCSAMGALRSGGEHTRVETLSIPVDDASWLRIDTHVGTISVHGGAVDAISLTATVQARAATTERARELTTGTKLRIRRDAERLKIACERPVTRWREYLGIALDVSVPPSFQVAAMVNQGGISVSGASAVESSTHNGSLSITEIAGDVEAQTYRGSVRCLGVQGHLNVHTHEGRIEVEDARRVPWVTVQTHSGGITLRVTPEVSAAVKMSANDGRLDTAIPLAVVGVLGRESRSVSGIAGDGTGRVTLTTCKGSVSIEGLPARASTK